MDGMHDDYQWSHKARNSPASGGSTIDPFSCLRPRTLPSFQDAAGTELMCSPTVSITLIPLDVSEASKPRHLLLNKGKRQIDVGRASRNPDRGAQPADDNAVFKCPIMSRLHARFTACPVENKIYIEDLQSTHGTFVGDKRVSQGSKMPIESGDVVTFGVRVVNGSLVYPAKAFHVEYKRQPRYSPDVPVPTSRVFRVPDSDNDAEILSTHSQESSVQVMESDIRTNTYSVPSGSDEDDSDDSDDYGEDDDLDNFSPAREPEKDGSAITTPDQHKVRIIDLDEEDPKSDNTKGNTMDLNLKGPKLQEVIAKTTGEGSSQNNPIDLDNKHIDKEARVLPSVLDCETDSEDEGPEVLPIQPSTKRSDIADLLNDKPAPARKTSAENMFDAGIEVRDSANAEKSQIERIIRETQRRVTRIEAQAEEEERSKEAGRARIPDKFQPLFPYGAEPLNVSATAGSGDEEEKEEVDEDFPIDYEEANDLGGPCIFEFDVEKPKAPTPFTEYPDLFRSGDMDFNGPSEECLIVRTPSPSDAALARSSSNLGTQSRRNAAFAPDNHAPVSTFYSSPDPHVPKSAFNDYSPFSDYQLPSVSRYDSGPFAMNTINVPSSAPDYISQEATQPARLSYDLSNGAAYYQPSSAEMSTSKTSGEQSSRLHISNLINSYHAEPSRGTKRKAAHISADQESAQSEPSRSDLPALSQDTLLPDAQPLDEAMITGASTALGEIDEANVNSMTTTVATEISTSKEPARKKSKTSSTASGIGKFLVGVGVGAIGLAAAFLATIPAHVQEEARLGL